MADRDNDDENRRKLLKPKISIDQALCILTEYYLPKQNAAPGADSEGSARAEVVKELDSYDDVNFLVKIDGVKHLLKIHNGVESEQYLAANIRRRKRARGKKNGDGSSESEGISPGTSVIDLHTAVFEHMRKHDISCPRTIPTISDFDPVCVHDIPVISDEHSPKPLVIRLQTWSEGSPLCSVSYFPIETLVDAGCFLGRMCRALDDLAATDAVALQASKRFHAWDGRNLMDLSPYVEHIDDLNRRKLVSGVISSFKKSFVDRNEGDAFRMGINHGDFNDGNIIVSDDGKGLKVAGAIDFGDTVHSWRVLDVTVAMAYALITSYGKNHKSISAACALLRGFHHTYPLTSHERKHLRLLIACRLAQSVTLGNYSYKLNPGNEYLLLHSKPAWDALYLIWGKDGNGACGTAGQVVDNAFRKACDNIIVARDFTIPDCADLSFPDPSVVDPFAPARTLESNKSSDNFEAEPTITFVTGNKKKAEEVRRILSSGSTQFPFAIANHKVDLPELQGDPLEIAREKCALAAKEVKGAVITEDTSLCFSALNGLPGPYIKWFLDRNGLHGLNDMISFSEDKSGYAQTVVAFCPQPGKEVITFDGRTSGKIVRPRGKLDFGWDPVFEPDEGNGLTYAEMSGEQKDIISHRKRAFAQLRDYFEQHKDELTNSIC